MNLLSIILIGISLSMDAFSLALCYGTYNLSKRYKFVLSMIVGVFHFFMPILGISLGFFLENILINRLDFFTGIIFIFIGIDMIVSNILNKEIRVVISIVGIILFALGVSIDSFSMGIGLVKFDNNILIYSVVFSICSLIFTYIGLNLGNFISNKVGRVSNYIGGIILIIMGLKYL